MANALTRVLEYVVKADTKNYNRGLRSIRGELAQFDREVRQSFEKAIGSVKAFEATTSKIKPMSFAFKFSGDDLKRLGSMQRALNNLSNVDTANIARIGSALSTVRIGNIVDAKQVAALQTFTNSMSRLSKMSTDVNKWNALSASVGSFAMSFGKLDANAVRNLSAVGDAMSGIAAASQRASRSVSTTNDVFQDTTKTVRGMVNDLRDLSRIMLIVSGILAAPILYAGKVWADFEVQLNTFKALAGGVEADVLALKEAAFSLGESTIFTATQVAEAGVQLKRFGLSAQEVLSTLPAVINTAIASNIELAEATNIIVRTMKGFKIEASEAAHVADVLTQATLNSGASMKDLGTMMGYVAPIAQATGQSLEDVAVAGMFMHDAGVRGSRAGTAMRASLTRLTKPGREAQKVLSSLGIEITATDGSMRSILDITKDFRDRLAGLTVAQKEYAIATVFGQYALSGISSVMNATDAEMQKYIQTIKEADGVSKDTAKTMQEGLMFAFKEMTSAIQTAAASFGEVFAPALISAMNAVRDFAQGIRALPDNVKKVIADFSTFFATTGILTSGLLLLVIAAGNVISSVKSIVGAVKLAIGMFTANTTAVAANTTAVAANTTALNVNMVAQGRNTAATEAGTIAIGGATIAVRSFALALGTLAIAIGGVYLAWREFQNLLEESRADERMANEIDKLTEIGKKRADALLDIRKKIKAGDALGLYKTSVEDFNAALSELNVQLKNTTGDKGRIKSDIALIKAWQTTVEKHNKTEDRHNKNVQQYLANRQMLESKSIDDLKGRRKELEAQQKTLRKQIDDDWKILSQQGFKIKNLEETVSLHDQLNKIQDKTATGGGSGQTAEQQAMARYKEQTTVLKDELDKRLELIKDYYIKLERKVQQSGGDMSVLSPDEQRKLGIVDGKVPGGSRESLVGSIKETINSFIESGEAAKLAANGFRVGGEEIFTTGKACAYTTTKLFELNESTRFLNKAITSAGGSLVNVPGIINSLLKQGLIEKVSFGDRKAGDLITTGRKGYHSSFGHIGTLVEKDRVAQATGRFAPRGKRHGIGITGLEGFNWNPQVWRLTEKAIKMAGKQHSITTLAKIAMEKDQAQAIREKISELEKEKQSYVGFPKVIAKINTDIAGLNKKLRDHERQASEKALQEERKRAEEVLKIKEKVVKEIAKIESNIQKRTMEERGLSYLNSIREIEDEAISIRMDGIERGADLTEDAEKLKQARLRELAVNTQIKINREIESLLELRHNRTLSQEEQALEKLSDRREQAYKDMAGIEYAMALSEGATDQQKEALKASREKIALLDSEIVRLEKIIRANSELKNIQNQLKDIEEEKRLIGVQREIGFVSEEDEVQNLLALNQRELDLARQTYDVLSKRPGSLEAMAEQNEKINRLLEEQIILQAKTIEGQLALVEEKRKAGVLTDDEALQAELQLLERKLRQLKSGNHTQEEELKITKAIYDKRAEIALRQGDIANYFRSIVSSATTTAGATERWADAAGEVAGQLVGLLGMLDGPSGIKQAMSGVAQIIGGIASKNPVAAIAGGFEVLKGIVSLIPDQAEINRRYQEYERAILAIDQSIARKRLEQAKSNAGELADVIFLDEELDLIKEETQRTLDEINAETERKLKEHHNNTKSGLAGWATLITGQLGNVQKEALKIQEEGQKKIEEATEDGRRKESEIIDRANKKEMELLVRQWNAKQQKEREQQDQMLEARREFWDEIEKIQESKIDMALKREQDRIDDMADGFKKIEAQAQLDFAKGVKSLQEKYGKLNYDPTTGRVKQLSLDDVSPLTQRKSMAYNAELDLLKDDVMRTAKESGQGFVKTFNGELRSLRMLEAQNTKDLLDDVNVQYQNTIDEINEYRITESRKAGADLNKINREVAAQMAAAEKARIDGVLNVMQTKMERLKTLREEQFELDTKEYRDIIEKETREIDRLDRMISSRRTELRKIEQDIEDALRRFDAEDKDKWRDLLSGFDLDSKTREAIKLISNPTGLPTSQLTMEQQLEAVQKYVAGLRTEADALRGLERITQDEYTNRMQSAALIQGKFADEQLSTLEATQAAEIAALRKAGKSEEEISVTAVKQWEKRLELLKTSEEAYTGYQELIRDQIRKSRDEEKLAIEMKISDYEREKLAHEEKVQEQESQIANLREAAEKDYKAIDEKVKEITRSHDDWGMSIESIRGQVPDMINTIVSEYQRAKSAVQSFNAEMMNTANTIGGGVTGGTSSSGSSYYTGSGEYNLSAGQIQPSPTYVEGQYTVQGRDGKWYRTTTEAEIAGAFAKGGIVPPGFPDDSFLARLSSREMVLPQNISDMLIRAVNGGTGHQQASNNVLINIKGNYFKDDIDVKSAVREGIEEAFNDMSYYNRNHYREN